MSGALIPLPIGGTLAALAAVMNQNAQNSGEFAGQTITLDPGDITPGIGGSLTDSLGAVFTLPLMTATNNEFNLAYPAGVVQQNGVSVINAAFMDAIRIVGGVLFAEDAKGNGWFSIHNNVFSQAAGDPGPGDGTVVGAPPPNIHGNISYILEQSSAATGPWVAVLGSPFSTLNAIITGLLPGTIYFLRLTAVDSLTGIKSTPIVSGPIKTNPTGATESPQGTIVNNTTNTIIDQSSNVWKLVASPLGGNQVSLNGSIITSTLNVVELEYFNHSVFMEQLSQGTPVFDDEFTTFITHDHAQTGDNWGYCAPDSQDGRGGPNFGETNDQWWDNPDDATTGVAGVYSQAGTNLTLSCVNTPTGVRAAINAAAGATLDPFTCALLYNNANPVISGDGRRQLFGYFEVATTSVARIPGFIFAWTLETFDHGWPPEINCGMWTNSNGNMFVHFSVAANVFAYLSSPNQFDITVPHKWAVNWQTDFITFYIDGVQIAQTPNPGGIYRTTPLGMYMLTGAGYSLSNTTSGPDVNPTAASLPAHAQIDSVKIWNTLQSNTPAWFQWNGTAFLPVSGPPNNSESAQGTLIIDTTSTIIAANGDIFKLASSATNGIQASRNGVVIASTANLLVLLYWAHQVYSLSQTNVWSVFNGTVFAVTTDPRQLALVESPSGATVAAGAAAILVDRALDTYALPATGPVVVNGTPDGTTSNEVLILYFNRTVYAQSSTALVVITPTSGGSVSDGTNTYTLDAAGNFIENGTAVPGGGGTSAITFDAGNVWAQDASTLQWFIWDQTNFNPQTGAPPDLGVGSSQWVYWNGVQWTSATNGDPRSSGVLPTLNYPTFSDSFNTLRLFDLRNTAAGGVWEPALWTAPDGQVSGSGNAWITNPFNPATPDIDLYTVVGGSLNLGVKQTPASQTAATSGLPYLCSVLTTQPSFRQLHGYFEMTCAVPNFLGLRFSLVLLSDQNTPPEISFAIQNLAAGQLGLYQIFNNDGSLAASWDTSNFTIDMTRSHSYGIDWNVNGTTTFFIDRVAVFSSPTPAGYTLALFPTIRYVPLTGVTISNPSALPSFAQVSSVLIYPASIVAPTANFTVSLTQGGFKDQTGAAFNMKGLNAGVADALAGFNGVLTQYPTLTTIRLNCNSATDTDANITSVVNNYTAKNIVIMIEDHSGNTNNVAWYTRMATAFKGNPYVFLEMPNDPAAVGNALATTQIGILNAIRNAGFLNPVGIQLGGGGSFDTTNLPFLTATGDAAIFATPHCYYNGTDPTGPQTLIQTTITNINNLHLWCSIDEFGDALNGITRDQFGPQLITAAIAANNALQCGACFWAMDNGNHADGADSAFLLPDGSQLTPVGANALKGWLGSGVGLTLTRNWFDNPGQDRTFWVQPFYTTAQWDRTSTQVTSVRNGPSGPFMQAHFSDGSSAGGDFCVPFYIGSSTDPLVTVTDGTKTIHVHIPLGAINEAPQGTSTDSSIGGLDKTQPYLCWSLQGANINTGTVAASGTIITGNPLLIFDGSGPVMMDVVTGVPGSANAMGNIQDEDLTNLNANASFVIPHMLAYSLDPRQTTTGGGSPRWPLKVIDTSLGNTGPVAQGWTLGIPSDVARPVGKTRGFYALWDVCQQFGIFFYNVNGGGGLAIEGYSRRSANDALLADMVASWSAVAANLCILSNQTSVASIKGFAPGGISAYPLPPALDLSPTGGKFVNPSSFGAYYSTGSGSFDQVVGPLAGVPAP